MGEFSGERKRVRCNEGLDGVLSIPPCTSWWDYLPFSTAGACAKS